MSADNYTTVKFNPEDLKWYSLMGFMSTLEDGIPALATEHTPRFDTYEEALQHAWSDWSEYGFIQEPGEFDSILTPAQFREYARKRIETLQWYLGNGDT